MRVVFLNDWYAPKMGYSDNLLCKALAAEGCEVHLVTSDLFPVFEKKEQALYNSFLGERAELGTSQVNGYTVHRLPHWFNKEGVWIRGLKAKLVQLKPQIVQNFKFASWNTHRSAYWARPLGYKLFLEDHVHWSVFHVHPWWKRLGYRVVYGSLLGPYASRRMEKCYAIAPDVREIGIRYFGLSPSKTVVMPLGYDSDVFYPATTSADAQDRSATRARLGVGPEEHLVIYTGRFTDGKNPALLAQAVHQLRQAGHPYRALLVGWGQGPYLSKLEPFRSSIVLHDFVEWQELAAFYRAADSACWPKQESTSQIDAAACGLPLILSDQVTVRERVAGNGYLYRENDANDLAEKLLQLADPVHRAELGQVGAARMAAQFSWRALARQRIADYEAAWAQS